MWAQHGLAALSNDSGDGSDGEIDVISTSTEAPRTRNVQDLGAQIQAAGGALVVGPNDSRYIVAVNNGLRYSVTQVANGQYRITESNMYLYLITGLIVVGVVVVMNR